MSWSSVLSEPVILAKYEIDVSLVAPGITLGIAMLPIRECLAMRLLSKKQVREKVLYSPAHIARLEAAGKFPKRVRLGAARVGWIEQEVEDWLRELASKRDTPGS
ncbi:AlpA family phage regulatory protein [Sphingomonas sp.]|uniref:helix-turn-helix transcriptional regulator n=1 Tax=Sphingomonas sp. TaxID=28214 RepID=UPI001B17A8D1|nr:AlpA family phage regulatory protein [Sphingomonas sp.]MBO9714244.1 AlpA family phage regulatory protein [Sphingomonas sp.]